jgi:hypothetical protein
MLQPSDHLARWICRSLPSLGRHSRLHRPPMSRHRKQPCESYKARNDHSDVDCTYGIARSWSYRTPALVGAAAIDIPALITLNLRAIGEYAAYYGFDTSRQEERLFAFNVLGLASSPTDSSKSHAMAQLIKISQDVAKKATWQELEKNAFVKIIQEIAKALGIRLTKAKLAQAIPAIGAAVGGGFNAYFTMKVCDAAYYLYRERFLAEKYGVEIIEETVKPATDYDPRYTEVSDPL